MQQVPRRRERNLKKAGVVEHTASHLACGAAFKAEGRLGDGMARQRGDGAPLARLIGAGPRQSVEEVQAGSAWVHARAPCAALPWTDVSGPPAPAHDAGLSADGMT